MRIGLVETKKARFLSDEGRSFKYANVAKKKQVVADKFDEISTDVSDSSILCLMSLKKTLMMKIAKGYLEAFSIGNFRN